MNSTVSDDIKSNGAPDTIRVDFAKEAADREQYTLKSKCSPTLSARYKFFDTLIVSESETSKTTANR